jgi:lysozyme
MRTGTFGIDGYTYSFDENGVMRTGLYTENGKTYYFGTDGKRASGFQKIDGEIYFFSRVSDNQRRTGWICIDSYMYYFDPTTAKMITGNIVIDNVNYIFQADGKLKDGFTTDTNGNVRYYFPDGSYANDWIMIAGKKYFFNSLGVMIGENVKKVIDISAHNKSIDWKKVKNEGLVDGVILRIAAGCEKEDSYFEQNIKALKELNIPYGIYIYSYAENYYEGGLYADFTLTMINKYNLNPTLGIYFDLESNSVTNYMGTTHYEQVVRGYFDRMASAGYGSMTNIYTYKYYAESALNTDYMRNLITWIAQYNHYCTYTGSYKGWQYSSTEYVPGIDGNVDVSVFWY